MLAYINSNVENNNSTLHQAERRTKAAGLSSQQKFKNSCADLRTATWNL